MNALEERIAALAAKFAGGAPEQREALSAALAAGDSATLVARAHKLAGIAGMVGYGEIGEAALALEDAALAGQDIAAPAAALLALLDAL